MPRIYSVKQKDISNQACVPTGVSAHKNALTLLDEIISHLTRDDPGETNTSAKFEKPPTGLIQYGELFGLEKFTDASHVEDSGTANNSRTGARRARRVPPTTTHTSQCVAAGGGEGTHHHYGAVCPQVWTIKGESAKEALYLALASLEVLVDFYPKILTFRLEDQLSFFTVCRNWPARRFKSYAKYVTAYPMAKYMRQASMPAIPQDFEKHSTALVYTGPIKRLLKNRLASRLNKTVSQLAFCILQGVKRSALEVNEHEVESSLVGHQKAMLSDPIATEEELESFQPLLDRALGKFKWRKPTLLQPSRSATYSRSRAHGGQLGEVVHHMSEAFQHADVPLTNLSGEIPRGSELLAMIEVRPGFVKELRGLPTPPFSSFLAEAHQLINPTTLLGNETLITNTPFIGGGARNIDAKVVPLKEPLKVRLITTGEALPYYTVKCAQKAMHRYLNRYVQFELTGREMNMGDAYAILTREKACDLNDFDKWVSGDYSAATDGLDINMTMMVAEAFLAKGGKLDERFKTVFRAVIAPHTLHYPKKWAARSSDRHETILQKNGQLMGSPLSFPILCLINVLCYWQALEAYSGRSFDMEDLPCIVNGDDILFRANDSFYAVWQETVKKVGFTLSIGKNYIHRSLLTVNSKLYQHHHHSNTFTEITFYHTGLVTGMAYRTGRQNVKALPLWDLYNASVPNCHDPCRAHRRFLHYHKERIAHATDKGRYNLFLPHQRGGLGFVPPPGHVWKITAFQRRYATFLEEEYLANLALGKDKSSRHALVRERDLSAPNAIVRYHDPGPLLLVPKIGPLLRNQRPLEDLTVEQPALSFVPESDPDYIQDLRLRIPYGISKRISKMEAPPNRMSTAKITSWPFRVVQEITLSCVVHTTLTHLHTN